VLLRIAELGDEVLGQQVAGARLSRHQTVVGAELVPECVRDPLDRPDG
jgi:hypothetical protein